MLDLTDHADRNEFEALTVMQGFNMSLFSELGSWILAAVVGIEIGFLVRGTLVELVRQGTVMIDPNIGTTIGLVGVLGVFSAWRFLTPKRWRARAMRRALAMVPAPAPLPGPVANATPAAPLPSSTSGELAPAGRTRDRRAEADRRRRPAKTGVLSGHK